MNIDRIIIEYSFKGERKVYKNVMKIKYKTSGDHIIESIQDMLDNADNIKRNKDNEYN